MDTNFLETLQIAAGSIPGREHTRSGRDNQDAFAYARTEAAWIGVVCDGCGSMPFSGVGAHLGARLLVRSLTEQLELAPERDDRTLLALAQAFLLDRLRDLARDLTPPGVPENGTIARRFLFTTVGFLIRPETTTVFACGDGAYRWNGDLHRLGPFPGNRPPYLGYRLLPEAGEGCDLDVVATGPTDELRELVVGSDGLLDWFGLEGHPEVPPPGDTLAHPAATRNPDFLRRRLTVAQRRAGPGALPDDTTLVLARREQP